MVYFLALLAVALGAASLMVYHSAQRDAGGQGGGHRETDRRSTRRPAARARCKPRSGAAGRRRRRWPAMARPDSTGSRLHERTVAYSTVSAARLLIRPRPTAWVWSPRRVWTRWKHGPFFADVSAAGAWERSRSTTPSVLDQVSKSDHYIQINSVLGASYRSRRWATALVPLTARRLHAGQEHGSSGLQADRIDKPCGLLRLRPEPGRTRAARHLQELRTQRCLRLRRTARPPRRGDERPPPGCAPNSRPCTPSTSSAPPPRRTATSPWPATTATTPPPWPPSPPKPAIRWPNCATACC